VTWWLKDILDPTRNLALRVKTEPTAVTTSNTAVAFQAMGADFAKVVTEGFKGDTVPVRVVANMAEHVALWKLLNSRRTLFLQSDADKAWWVRAVGDIPAPIQATGKRKTEPLRFIDITFVQVAPEE
jgi:hypothetical protein